MQWFVFIAAFFNPATPDPLRKTYKAQMLQKCGVTVPGGYGPGRGMITGVCPAGIPDDDCGSLTTRLRLSHD
jgi:hypothetical protein